MKYPEQLKTIHWQNKRNEILKRDNFECQNCSNENFLSELNSGFFIGYCFPNNKNAIQLHNFGDKKFMRSGIKEGYSKFLTESTIVYSKRIYNWRRMVFGSRKLNSAESIIFNQYASEIKRLEKLHSNKSSSINNDSIIPEIADLKERRRLDFCQINKSKDKNEWIFMLGLHIHHKYYIKEFQAWEYDNDALITLCPTCHENLHKDQEITVYNRNFEWIDNFHYCKRCFGAGVFAEYSHVQNGICFRCNGKRYEELITNANIV